MPYTRGGENKRKAFEWSFDAPLERLTIIKESGDKLEYSLDQIVHVLNVLHGRFRAGEFPLANNVEKLADGSEQDGLGMTILDAIETRDTTRGQGASYLGVVLEEAGYFVWNGEHKGIRWSLTSASRAPSSVNAAIVRAQNGL